MNQLKSFLTDHEQLTRRFFLRAGVAGSALATFWPLTSRAEPPTPELAKAIESLEPFFTPPEDFRDVSRGKPLPHSLPDEKKAEVGLTRETWKLEVVSDPDNPAKLGNPLTKEAGHGPRFCRPAEALGEKHAVRFAKVMTCLNIGCPLGMGIWEGVPLREVLWLTQAAGGCPPRLLLRLSQRRRRSRCSAARCRSAACSKTRTTCRRSSSATSSTASGSTASAAGRSASSCPRLTASSRSSGCRTSC